MIIVLALVFLSVVIALFGAVVVWAWLDRRRTVPVEGPEARAEAESGEPVPESSLVVAPEPEQEPELGPAPDDDLGGEPELVSESGPSAFDDGPEPEFAVGPRAGKVLAMLRPRGLVLVDGTVEPAYWCGAGDGPERDAMVLVTRSVQLDGWLAGPASGPQPDSPGGSPAAVGGAETSVAAAGADTSDGSTGQVTQKGVAMAGADASTERNASGAAASHGAVPGSREGRR